jgi:hypothetical protein
MSFDTVIAVVGFLLSAACFFGVDRRYRGWNRIRSIARLEKQRAYCVELAASESAQRRLIYTNLFVLIALLFSYLMFLGMTDAGPTDKAFHVIQPTLGLVGYTVAIITLGRLTRIRSMDKYLARVNATLAKLDKDPDA